MLLEKLKDEHSRFIIATIVQTDTSTAQERESRGRAAASSKAQ